MNRLGLNILLVVLLSGCSVFNKNPRTDSKGETISKNAPIFITPKANAPVVNKPITNQVELNKPPQVIFNAENYVMVKEKDLNAIVDQKTNEKLLNIKKSNANAKQPNKELDAAIDEHIHRKKSGDSETGSLTPNVVQLAPVIVPEKPSNSSPVHPLFAFILVVLSVAAFILAVGYFLFIKKRASHEAPTTTTPATPTPTKVATETAAKDSANKDTEAKAD